jgi:hypothetical protein
MKRESEAEKKLDEISQADAECEAALQSGDQPGFVPEEGPRGSQFDAIFGYKFGYRHQFALITANSAKLRSKLDLGKS